MDGEHGAILSLAGVTFKYRTSRAPALDVDLSFQTGRTILLGPNGAGKSTLFKLCANRMRMQSGSIELRRKGRGCKSQSRPYRAQVGYMPQSPSFIHGMTVKEHLTFAAWLAGVDGREAQDAVSVWIDRVNLERQQGSLCTELSGGQQRRLAFASAGINSPSVLLLDEPTAGLDPIERGAFREVIRNYGPEAILLISTHQVDDLDLVADRVVVLASGQIMFHDDIRTFLAQAESDLPPLARAESAYAATIDQGRYR